MGSRTANSYFMTVADFDPLPLPHPPEPIPSPSPASQGGFGYNFDAATLATADENAVPCR